MHLVFDILLVLLALIALGSAVYDFRDPPEVVELMARLGHRPGFQRTLGIIKAVGALGLLIGLALPGLGIVAALCFVVYFGMAVASHRRIDDPVAKAVPALGLCALSLVTGIVGIAS